jgi:hypothetical protein
LKFWTCADADAAASQASHPAKNDLRTMVPITESFC